MSKIRVIGLMMVLGLGFVVAQVAGLSAKIQGYTGWTRVNINKITEGGAHPAAKDVYVNIANDRLAAAYQRPFAAGTLFVKERVDPATLVVTTLYVMEKRSATAKDWSWGVFERKGERFEGGVLANPAMCVGCHEQAAATDLVFTRR